MRKNVARLTLLGLASASLLSACVDDSTGPDAIVETSDDGTQVIRPTGDALTAPSTATRLEIVRALLRGRGQGGAAAQLVETGAGAGVGGLTHLMLEQHVDGLRVHGAYVKAAIDEQGQVVHAIVKVAPGGAIGRTAVTAPQALATALASLGYDEPAPATVGTKTQTTRFAKTATFFRGPQAERVVYVDDVGLLREGFLVETWSNLRNQLDETLVGADGAIVSSVRRTAQDAYNVFPEDPGKGAQTTVTGGNWLGTAAQTTINISGPNAKAYLDRDANNAADAGGTAVTDGNFVSSADLAAAPTTTSNAAVAVQNLFYLTNVTHDLLEGYGFDNAHKNFEGNDPVLAEAQDGSGTDNANFSTPTDGSSPRMQMYLWTGAAPTAFVDSDGASYDAYGSSFGAALTTTGTTAADLVVANDGTGVTSDGCEAMSGYAGKVVIVDRGSCNFTVKVLNAQRAGAIAVIIANNDGSAAFAAGGTDRKIKISSAMVSLADGAALKATAGAANLTRLRKNATPALQIDGDLDSDIVFHEYGHGLTWRMIGGMSGALAGALGEGAADVNAFLINGDDRIGEYAYSDALGIRRYPYASYGLTYSAVTGAEVHNDGEIYAAAMWAVMENYQAAGLTAADLHRDFVQGMNFTPSTPTFEMMRDGLIQAAGSDRECLIWRGFAKYGIGVGSSGTVNRRGQVTIVASTAVPATCQ